MLSMEAMCGDGDKENAGAFDETVYMGGAQAVEHLCRLHTALECVTLAQRHLGLAAHALAQLTRCSQSVRG